MANKYFGGIAAGAIEASIAVLFRKKADNTEMTGLTKSAVAGAAYWRQGESIRTFTLTNLASIGAAWVKGGFKQVSLTNAPGLYRLDVPNSAIAAGAEFVVFIARHASTYAFEERFGLATRPNNEIYDAMAKSAIVPNQIDARLSAMHLDHLLLRSAPDGVPASNTIFEKVMVSTAGGTFTRASHSLKALRNKANELSLITGASVAAAVWNAQRASYVASGSFGQKFRDLATSTIVATKITAYGGATSANVVTQFGLVPSAVWGLTKTGHVAAGTMGGLLSNAAVGGAVNSAAIANAVWKASAANHVNVAGTMGRLLSNAAVGGSVTIGGATASNIAAKVWQLPRSSYAASGTFGQAVGAHLSGFGDTPVDHNFGSTDAYRVLDSTGTGIGNVVISAYLKSDYDSGLRSAAKLKGRATTNDAGRWKTPIYLDDGVAYTLVFTKTGAYEDQAVEITP